MIFNEAEIIFSDKLCLWNLPSKRHALKHMKSKLSQNAKLSKKGKRDEDLKGLPVKIIEHTISDEELNNGN